MGNYVDKNAVMHVLGNIYNNLELSNDERYPFRIDDFYDDFHKTLYTVFYNLYSYGNKTISEIEILDYLTTRPKIEGIFNANNGFEYVKTISESSNLASFEYWYQRLKKFSLLNAYDTNGIDVREYYDPDNITDTQKKQVQNDWIDKTSLDEMANIIEDKCVKIRENHIDNAMNDIVKASIGLEDLIERLQEVPAYGYPLYGDYINTITRGARLGELYLRSGSSGSGKAIPNDTLIPTPTGYKRVDEIKIGDELFDGFGKPTKVLNIFPQGQKEVWEITFKDGRKAKCCEEHLWSYCTANNKKDRNFITKTLKEIVQTEDIKNNQILVPMQKAVEYSEKKLPTNPYYLGLQQAKSKNKSIPTEYLFGSIKQRTELLNGLLNADGLINTDGRISYFTESEQLKNNIIELAEGLGFKVTVETDTYEKVLPCYTIHITVHSKTEQLNDFNQIVDIQNLHYKTEMTCFIVDNPEHLFLMNDYIVTHNSRAFMADACCIGLSSYYDEKLCKWIDTNTPEPTLLISTEQQRSELQTMMLAFVSGVPEEHILLGQYSELEYERILKANEIIQNGKLSFFNITNFGMNDILNVIKRSIRKDGIKYFFLDYLHTSINIMSEIGSQTKGIALREDQILFMLADKLKQICLEEGVFIFTGTQLNGDYAKGVLDQNALRGSKAIADKISVGIITVRVTKEDLEHLQTIIEEKGCEIPKFKMSIYKNRGGKLNNILLWCEDRRDYSKINPLFATTTDYEYIEDLQDTKIKIDNGVMTNGAV